MCVSNRMHRFAIARFSIRVKAVFIEDKDNLNSCQLQLSDVVDVLSWFPQMSTEQRDFLITINY